MNKLLTGILAISILTISCKKDCSCPATTTPLNISNTEWSMFYRDASNNKIYYGPQMFIKSGSATYPSTLPHIGFWFTAYDLPIPPELNLNIDSDSLKLVVNARNVLGDGSSNEISISLENDSSVSATWQKGNDPTNCRIQVGSQITSNITEQLTDPSTYTEYSLAVQNHSVITAKNNSSTKTVSYSGNVGNLRSLYIYYRGYGQMDWVKLYKGNKLIMSEDFNTDGKTTAVWVAP